VLQDAYFEAHPELATSAQGSPQGPQPSPEEVSAWVAEHGDDLARYQQAVQASAQGAPAPKPESFASAFIYADKARAEGLDKQPSAQLELKLARYGLLYQQMDKKLEDETKYSDDEARKYYEEHKASGDLDQVHLQHILFATVAMPSPENPAGGAAPDPAAKEQLAEQVLQRIKNGEDFGELAKQYSDDPGSKDKGGDLGWAPRFKFVPPFEEAAWKLQPGQVSDVVKTDYGFHIIKMLERKPPEELTPQTIEQLKEALSQRRLEETMNEIAERNDVKLPDDFTVAAPQPPANMPMMPGMGGPGNPHGGAMPPPDDLDEPAPPAAGAKPEAGKPAKKGAK
jgi:peptidyl-prolyl cis-trans isomerase C